MLTIHSEVALGCLAVVLLALGILQRAQWLEWVSGLKTTLGLAGDPCAYFKRLERQGTEWVRLTPGAMGGRRTIMVIEPQLIQQVYKASGTSQSSARAAHYFDYAVFDLSAKWLSKPSTYKFLEPIFYKVFASAAVEESGQRFRARFERIYDTLDRHVKEDSTGTLLLYKEVLYDALCAMQAAFFGPDVDAAAVLPGLQAFDRDFHLAGACTALPLPLKVSRRLIARNAYRGLWQASDAFQVWLDQRGHDSAMKGFSEVLEKMRFHPDLAPGDAARMCCGVNFAAASNTFPITFWTLLMVIGSPKLLKRVRKDIQALRDRGDPADLTVAKLPQCLPLLRSCFYETLRFWAHSFGVRLVMKECAFATQQGRTLVLREGDCIMFNGGWSHFDAEKWSDPDVWDSDRFLDDQGEFDAGRAASIYSFGGGIGVCRGRTLAVFEVLWTIMSLVEHYDFEIREILDYSGRVVPGAPRTSKGEDQPVLAPADIPGRFGSSAIPPDGDCRVTIRARSPHS